MQRRKSNRKAQVVMAAGVTKAFQRNGEGDGASRTFQAEGRASVKT